jgi:hypothetical protein
VVENVELASVQVSEKGFSAVVVLVLVLTMSVGSRKLVGDITIAYGIPETAGCKAGRLCYIPTLRQGQQRASFVKRENHEICRAMSASYGSITTMASVNL